jgi:hypothetical protein
LTAPGFSPSQSATCWTPVLEAAEATAAVAVARDVVTRLRDPARVDAAAVAAEEQTAFPRSVRWQPHGLFQGYAGLALLCGAADASMPDEGWDAAGHEHLARAASAAEQSPLSSGMSAGLGGLTFTAWHLSRRGARYRRLLRTLDIALIHRVRSAATALSSTDQGVGVSVFDVISGLSGVGGLLLLRSHEPEYRSALEEVLRRLTALTEEQDGVPRWHTPARFLADESSRLTYPHGNLNCGMAHGIPGPLALLSLAAVDGITVDGQTAAIRRAADWLYESRIRDQWGVNWPGAVPLRPPAPAARGVEQQAASGMRPSRTAWCYGSPGIARSLWLAGAAVNETGYRDLAVSAMEAVYRRPLSARNIDSPTFCHGVAGLQQITLRFAHDSGLPLFVDAARTLHRQLMDAYEPASVFGYRNLEPGGRRIDQPGLLDGAPGVALALLAAASPVEPDWDRLFLLS